MAATVVGRSGEIKAIGSVLDDAVASPSGMLVEGEAGIGKTTIWREGLRLASQRGLRTLLAQPAESEASLPYGALADLVQEIPSLDGGLRSILDPAFAGASSDRLAVSRAALELVRRAAAERPLLVAVDDVQWLDPPSEAVLTFVLRRLAGLPVRVLATRRTTESLPAPLGIDRAFDDRFHRVWIGPLPIGDLDRLLRDRLDLRLPRPRLSKLHRAAGGNPFYALEIARSLDPGSGVDDDVSVPAHLGAVVEMRLRAMSEDARDAALLTAACLHPTPQIVESAAGGSQGLRGAVDAGVLHVDRMRLRFTHPLLASISYESASRSARRDAHARLAGVADTTPLERAHHLARATAEANETIAEELDTSAEAARSAGASELAAELSDHALRLTPKGSPQTFARGIASAKQRLAAGDPVGARVRLERLVASLAPGLQRAQALAEIADIDGYPNGVGLGMQALEEAADDPVLQGEIHLMISTFLWNHGEIDRFLEHLRAAVALAERAGDVNLLAMSLAELTETEALIGLPLSEERVERLFSLERQAALGLSTYMRPSFRLGCTFLITDRLVEARRLLQAELARIDELGNEAIRWGILVRLSDLELRAGDLGAAMRHAQAGIESVRLMGEEPHPVAILPYARVLAYLGDLDAATEAASEALAAAERLQILITSFRARAVLGFIALSRGEAHEALQLLRPVAEEIRRMNLAELSIYDVAENAIEAAVAVGELDEAEALASWIEEKGRPAARLWHRAVAARGRAMIAAERGDATVARARIAEALEAHEHIPQPFELARTLLAQGRIERRAKNRRAAREALTRALDLFDEIGAARFAEIAASELARIPGRAPASGELTETERRVAELVASGLSNKQIATQLFVTVRTVEANLTRVYSKLGVRSRTELVGRLTR